MNNRCKKWWMIVLIIGVFAMTARAQSGRKTFPPSSEKPVLQIETREVLLPLSAYDAEGRNVTDLEPKDVLVLENGEPRLVTSLRREPASVVLVLDLSNEIGTFKNGSSQRLFPREEQNASNRTEPIWAKENEIMPRPAAREFADNFVMGLASGDRIAIIQYADRVQLIQDWTNDKEQALIALRSKYRAGLKARYYDALALAANKLHGQLRRRVVVLLSDGIDTASKMTRQESITALTRIGATVFVISWGSILRTEIKGAIDWAFAHERQNSAAVNRTRELQHFLARLDGAEYDLNNLAGKTGGEMIVPTGFNQLVTAAPGDLHREIGAQYSLAFLTEQGEGLESEREIEVLAARRGLSVRSRRLYFAGGERGQE